MARSAVPVGGDFWGERGPRAVCSGRAKVCQQHRELHRHDQVPSGAHRPTAGKRLHANWQYVVPMASHEGALLASYARGATAITASGGVNVGIKGRSMIRVPVFIFGSIVEARAFYRFVHQEEALCNIAQFVVATPSAAR